MSLRWHFFNLSSSFTSKTLTLCWILVNYLVPQLGFVNNLWRHWADALLAETILKCCHALLHIISGRTWCQYALLLVMLNSATWLWWCLLGFFTTKWNLRFPPLLQINSILKETIWEYTNVLFLLTLWPPNFSIHWWILPTVITMVFKGWFSVVLFLLHLLIEIHL